jgi:hypothetical protein
MFGPHLTYRFLAAFDDDGNFRFRATDEVPGVLDGVCRLTLEFTALVGDQFPRFLARSRRVTQRNAYPDERADGKCGDNPAYLSCLFSDIAGWPVYASGFAPGAPTGTGAGPT